MPGKDFRFSCYCLIRNDEGLYLLLQRSPGAKHFPGKWELSGGKPNPGETLPQAVLREIGEEARLPVSLEGVAGLVEFAMPAFQAVMVVMLGRAASDRVTLSGEHKDFQWVPRDKLLDMDLTDQLRRFLAAYLPQSAGGDGRAISVPGEPGGRSAGLGTGG